MNLRTRLSLVVLLAIGPSMGGAPEARAATESSAPTALATVGAAEDSSRSAVDQFLSQFSASFDATLASRYLFQGIDYSDGKSVLQPNLAVSRGGLSAVAWANYQPNQGDVNEVDLSFKAIQSARWLTGSAGYTYLRYPNRDWEPSHEVFADLSADAPLHPSLSFHYDFGAGDGSYSTLGVSQTFASLVTLGSNVFYQNEYYGMTGVPSVELKASATFPYAGMSLTPALSRFATTDNGDFTGPGLRVPAGWLFSLNIVPKP